MEDFNSKHTGQKIEDILDSVLAGGGGGGASPDLSDYATKEELNNKVDKVDGKQLSTEDFTTALKNKLNSLNNYDDTEISEAVNTLREDFNTLVSGDTTTAIKSFNDIVAFLNGIEDSESLDSIIASIQLEIAKKQVELVSGVNIKTINGQSILGSGNIQIESDYSLPAATTNTRGGVKIGSGIIVDNTDVLHAKVNESTGLSITNNGIEIKLGTGLKVGNQNRIETNLKTINGQSIEGSGNIEIQGGGEGEDIRYFTEFTVEDMMNSAKTTNILLEDASQIIEAARANKIICIPFKDYNQGYLVANYQFKDGEEDALELLLIANYNGVEFSVFAYYSEGYYLNGYQYITYKTQLVEVSGNDLDIEVYDNHIYICGNPLTRLYVNVADDLYRGSTIRFSTGVNCTLGLSGVKWANGVIPNIEDNTYYELSLVHTFPVFEIAAVLTPFKTVK